MASKGRPGRPGDHDRDRRPFQACGGGVAWRATPPTTKVSGGCRLAVAVVATTASAAAPRLAVASPTAEITAVDAATGAGAGGSLPTAVAAMADGKRVSVLFLCPP